MKDFLLNKMFSLKGKTVVLTAAVIWLLSESTNFVTGSVITIDGGFDAFSGV